MTNEIIKEESLEIMASASEVSETRSEIQAQVDTAKRWPRNVSSSRAGALALATSDESTAESCFYALKRGRGASAKMITGPSARLAEIVAYSWGNLRFGGTIIAQNNKFITGRGFAHDLERNIAVNIDNQRRITDRNGRTYSEDMIVMTGNAAISIALRNAIFKIIPRAFVQPIENAARAVAVGDAQTLSERLQKCFAWFSNLQIDEEDIFNKLERQSREDITVKDLEFLTGLKTALRDGTTTPEEAFPKGNAGKGFALENESEKNETSTSTKAKNNEDNKAPGGKY
jgi:hypothetical protein